MKSKNLTPPTSQKTEVLHELLTRFNIDRRSMMISCGVLNLTANISLLRELGVPIESNKVFTKNKFGREVWFTRYECTDKKQARAVYDKLQSLAYAD